MPPRFDRFREFGCRKATAIADNRKLNAGIFCRTTGFMKNRMGTLTGNDIVAGARQQKQSDLIGLGPARHP